MLRHLITVLDEGHLHSITAVFDHETVYLSPESLRQTLGWERKSEGLCRDELCVPVPDDMNFVKMTREWAKAGHHYYQPLPWQKRGMYA